VRVEYEDLYLYVCLWPPPPPRPHADALLLGYEPARALAVPVRARRVGTTMDTTVLWRSWLRALAWRRLLRKVARASALNAISACQRAFGHLHEQALIVLDCSGAQIREEVLRRVGGCGWGSTLVDALARPVLDGLDGLH
jgi:hypothetical protein